MTYFHITMTHFHREMKQKNREMKQKNKKMTYFYITIEYLSSIQNIMSYSIKKINHIVNHSAMVPHRKNKNKVT